MLFTLFDEMIPSVLRAFVVSALGVAPLAAAERSQELLVAVSNAPAVQMLVPGFTARQLPLRLNNINNLVYAPDGRLFALGYDGNVHQLKDTDGDGLEDTASFFYKNDKNQLLPSIGMCWGPGGLYIASQKRVIRLRDKGDGTSEMETVTGDWVEPAGKAGSNLDSVGIAVDRNGNIFFGLGCDQWFEAYKVNTNTAKSEYDIHSERGTILQISADWKSRKPIATGLRFPVSLAFNAEGDLFCTDQEGATWLANGNPFDELLHIQPGRHYGFPPQHPKYLPGVIDEPSLFDYAPQHQSTCGLHFNDSPGSGTRIFGPAWWRGDAIVAGESRGKIWRTKLVKTVAGYVARTDLIACLNMLTLDAVPTPKGELLVACHSGKPDWGTGPQGEGKLFKIAYTDNTAAQPLFAFAASPTETRVVFDRPLDPTQLKNLAASSGIVMGRYVAAADRYESFRPGYQVVEDQQKVTRRALAVLSAGVTPDNRAIVLQSAPRIEAVNYAVTMPGPAAAARHRSTEKTEPGRDLDLLADLTGVEAEWIDAKGGPGWNGWLPHLDLVAARGFTSASAEYQRLFELLLKPGLLRLRCQLDLDLMLHPKTQPCQKLSYEYPPETVTIELKSKSKLDVKSTADVKKKGSKIQVTHRTGDNRWIPLEISLVTGVPEAVLDVSWFTAADERRRPLLLRRILLPWAEKERTELVATDPRRVPELDGGDWEQGKKLFLSEQAACSKCHQCKGEGGKLGPDLSTLGQRDYASVLKDINEPSAAINPDHLAYNIELKDSEAVTGVILDDQPKQVVVGLVNAQTLTVSKEKIATMKASSVSLMPEGLLKTLTPEQQKNLLTFLLLERPTTNSRLKVLVVTGGHGYEKAPFERMFNNDQGIATTFAEHQGKDATVFEREDLLTFDVVVLYDIRKSITDAQKAKFLALLEKGRGLVVLHHALVSYQHWPEYEKIIGGLYPEEDDKSGVVTEQVGYEHDIQIPVTIVAKDHPITAGLKDFTIHDEIYWGYRVDREVTPLISTTHPKSGKPLGWCREQGKSRVVYLQLGHGPEAFEDANYRKLLGNSMRWVARR